MYWEVLKNIAAVAGAVATILGLLTTVSKSFRERLKTFVLNETTSLVESNQEQDKKLDELLDYIKKVDEKVEKVQSNMSRLEHNALSQKDFAKLECRVQLERIYHEGMLNGRLSFFKRQAADNIYRYYSEELHENSWGKLLYEQLVELPVDKYEDTNPEQ